MTARTLDATEVAERLGLKDRGTVLRMAARREIAHVRVGRRVRFTEKAVADYLAANEVPVGMVRTALSQRRSA